MEQKKAPYHPGQAKKTTSYLSKIDSYGRARVSSSPSTVGCRAKRAGGGCHARSRARRSQISARGVSMAPCHPGQAKKTTGYLSKIDSYGRARVSSSPSKVGCHAKRAGGGCHARARARRSQISARGVSMAPCHPGKAKKTTGYLSKIDSYGRARVSSSPS